MNTIDPEKMNEQAKATLRHGVWILNEASKLYLREGVPLPLDVTLLGDQRISYEVGISKDYGTDPFNRMVGFHMQGARWSGHPRSESTYETDRSKAA